MNRQEYFDRRLQLDIVKNVMRRRPAIRTEQVLAILNNEIGADYVEHELEIRISPVLQRHLSIRRLQYTEGGVIDELPQWMRPALAEEIAADYEDETRNIVLPEIYLPHIQVQIESLLWRQGAEGMVNDLETFIADMKEKADRHLNFPVLLPEEFGLRKKYEDAKRITVRERILNNNDMDVAEYRAALHGYSESLCRKAMHTHLAQLYADIADSPELLRIIRNLKLIIAKSDSFSYALLPDHPKEWDDAYLRIMNPAIFDRPFERLNPNSSLLRNYRYLIHTLNPTPLCD